MGPTTCAKPLRVLFYEHNVDGTVGGSHFCLLEICRAVDRTLIDPVVVFAQENTLLDQFQATGVQVLVMPPSRTILLHSRPRLLGPLPGVVQSLANAFRTLVVDALRWRSRLRRLRIDLLHLNNSSGGDHEAVLGAMLARVPVVAHQRGYPPGFGRRELWFARRMRSVVAISVSVRQDLLDKGLDAGRIVLIHDGIDPSRVVATAAHEDARSKFALPAGALVVGVVGNVKAWKGQETLVRALPLVAQQFPDVCCLVVGSVADDEYMQRLQRLIAEGNLADRVIFTGYQKYPAACMAAMDVVVHTSTSPEPFGLVVLEGMALGKPVVATAHGGPLDVVVEGETGFLTAPGDATQLAAVLARLLGDAGLRQRVGAAGRARLLDKFTAERNVRQLERVLLAAR